MLIFFLLAPACTHATPYTPPCHEGWSTDNSGSSETWTPTPVDYERVVATLPRGRKIHCFHRMPSGKMMVVNSGDFNYLTEFIFEKDSVKIIVEEGIVSTHH